MAQVLSTFSRVEQSRFEAFRRSTFSRDAISDYIAECMVQTQEQRHGLSTSGCKQYYNCKTNAKPKPTVSTRSSSTKGQTIDTGTKKIGSAKAAPAASSKTNIKLENLCVPGQAEEITIVVSTLAKSYAQRLVTAARRKSSTSDNVPIQPQHILDAFKERQSLGLDPGFFLQPLTTQKSSLTLPISTPIGQKEYKTKRSAVLHYQEQFDKFTSKVQKEREEKLREQQEEDNKIEAEILKHEQDLRFKEEEEVELRLRKWKERREEEVKQKRLEKEKEEKEKNPVMDVEELNEENPDAMEVDKDDVEEGKEENSGETEKTEDDKAKATYSDVEMKPAEEIEIEPKEDEDTGVGKGNSTEEEKVAEKQNVTGEETQVDEGAGTEENIAVKSEITEEEDAVEKGDSTVEQTTAGKGDAAEDDLETSVTTKEERGDDNGNEKDREITPKDEETALETAPSPPSKEAQKEQTSISSNVDGDVAKDETKREAAPTTSAEITTKPKVDTKMESASATPSATATNAKDETKAESETTMPTASEATEDTKVEPPAAPATTDAENVTKPETSSTTPTESEAKDDTSPAVVTTTPESVTDKQKDQEEEKTSEEKQEDKQEDQPSPMDVE